MIDRPTVSDFQERFAVIQRETDTERWASLAHELIVDLLAAHDKLHTELRELNDRHYRLRDIAHRLGVGDYQ